MAAKLQLPPLSFQPLTSSSHLPLPDSPPFSRPSSKDVDPSSNAPAIATSTVESRSRPLATKQSSSSLRSPTSPASPKPGSIRRFLSKMSMNGSYRDSDTASIASTKVSKSPPSTAQSYAESVSGLGRSPSHKSSYSVLPRRNTAKRAPSRDHEDSTRSLEDMTAEALKKDPAPKLPDVPSTDLSFDLDMFSSVK